MILLVEDILVYFERVFVALSTLAIDNQFR